MGERWNDKRLNPADAELIEKMARKFARINSLPESDVEDLQQAVFAHVISVSHHHKEERGSRRRFVSRVAKNKLRNILDGNHAQKRDRRRDVSIEKVGEPALGDGTTAPEVVVLELDFKEAMARLPADLQWIARLRIEHTEREIETILGLTRGQVRGRLKQIESILRAAGINEGFFES